MFNVHFILTILLDTVRSGKQLRRTACLYRAGVSRATSLHGVLKQTVTVSRQFCITFQNSDLWQGTQRRLAITDCSVQRFRLIAMDARSVGAINQSQRPPASNLSHGADRSATMDTPALIELLRDGSNNCLPASH